MSKILLIKPIKIDCSFVITPPLGLMYISSVLRERGHDIIILDMRLDKLKPEDVVKRFKDFKPDIVGFSTITTEANLMHQIAALLKGENQRCKIIVGGPHANSYPQETILDNNIDFLVLGEGEQTVPELIDAIDRNSDFKDVKGIAFRNNGQVTFTCPRSPITDLDGISFPAWDLIEMKKYFYSFRWNFFNLVSSYPYMTIFTSRGCPYNCIYCHNMFSKGFHARSPENVLSEIETLINRYNIRKFAIIDDCFNLDLKRAKDICDLIITRNLKIKLSFPNGLRCDVMDDELLDKLKKAGTHWIAYGIETASSRLQKFIKKNLNLEKTKKIISKTTKLGIFTHGHFMFGLPTETKEEILETMRFAAKGQLGVATFCIVNPFGGTELFRIAKQLGKNSPDNFDNYSYAKANFNLSEVKDEELFWLQRKAYRVFYLNIKRIILILRTYHNIKALLKCVPIFLNRAFIKRRDKF